MSGKYIVVFKEHATEAEITKYANEVTSAGGSVKDRYDSVLKGFSATIPNSYLQQLQSLEGGVVDYIEPDSEVRIQ